MVLVRADTTATNQTIAIDAVFEKYTFHIRDKKGYKIEAIVDYRREYRTRSCTFKNV